MSLLLKVQILYISKCSTYQSNNKKSLVIQMQMFLSKPNIQNVMHEVNRPYLSEFFFDLQLKTL